MMDSPQYDYKKLARCGQNVFISANVEIRRPRQVKIGSHVAIDTGFYCTTGLVVGDYCHLAAYSTVIGGETALLWLGNFCFFGAGSRMICGSDGLAGDGLVGPTIPLPYKDTLTIKPIVFEDFAGTATNVVIAPGVTLGRGSVVGVNSFVMEDTEPWTIYYGTPAKPVKARRKETILKYARALGYGVVKQGYDLTYPEGDKWAEIWLEGSNETE